MSKPLNKANKRLASRRAGFSPTKSGATKLPGSMNPHKGGSPATGRRTSAKIKADSRSATTR